MIKVLCLFLELVGSVDHSGDAMENSLLCLNDMLTWFISNTNPQRNAGHCVGVVREGMLLIRLVFSPFHLRSQRHTWNLCDKTKLWSLLRSCGETVNCSFASDHLCSVASWVFPAFYDTVGYRGMYLHKNNCMLIVCVPDSCCYLADIHI